MMISSFLDLPPGVPAYAALRDHLRADIVSGRIPAGTRLTTASLVERFGISQMPVREALQALEGEGLINILPHKGAKVLSLDARRVSNIYDVRGVIESLLIRLAVPNLTNAAMARLAEIHETLKKEVREGDDESVFALNQEFHKLIYRHAENADALGVYDRYANLLGVLRGTYGFDRLRLRQMVDEHGQILEALRAQDEERLEKLARLHCEGAKVDLVARMEPEGSARSAKASGGARRITEGVS